MGTTKTLSLVIETEGFNYEYCSGDCPFYDISSPDMNNCRLFGPIWQTKRSHHCKAMEKAALETSP